MKLGVMQPYFFPYIGYWQLIKAVDKYVIYDDVDYIKRGWVNRNNILMNNKANLINLIVKRASQNTLINELHISEDDKWKLKLLKTIKHAYKRAPYFDIVFPIVEGIINYDEEILSLYLENSIKEIANYLEIETEFILSSNIEKDNDLKGQDKIIEICKCLGATEYYNAIGGVELYNKKDFESKGITLNFVKTNSIVYKQFDNSFISNLSIIDVLMFNSKENVKVMLNNYSLQ